MRNSAKQSTFTRLTGKARARLLASLILLTGIFTLVQCSHRHVIFHNANILTMDAAGTVADALSVRNGIVSKVGTSAELLGERSFFTRSLDMQGKTIIPGFVDAHSHFPASGVGEVTLDLSAPPLGDVDTLSELYRRVTEAAKDLTDDQWLIGFNYDQASLQEGRHPDRQQLDLISTEHPIYLYHSSGHMGVANSPALLQLGVFGAVGNHNGLLREKAAPTLAHLLSRLSVPDKIRIFFNARDEYARHGVTTVVNGATNPALFNTLRWLSMTPLMPLRTVVSPLAESIDPQSWPRKQLDPGSWKDHFFGNQKFFTGPVKFTVDGSPQGYTAWLEKPYFAVPEGTDDGYRGHALISQQVLDREVRRFSEAGWQLALHGNGDAAIGRILDSLEAADLSSTADRRPILVHAQTATRQQVARMAELGVVPSFFTAHVYYWGEWHSKRTLGPQRAAHISPTGWAREEGIRFSLHSDAPVTPMRPLELLSKALTRLTHEGKLLGEEHRLSPLQALRALTSDAAWQYFIEDRVGSLEVGKWADMAVLSHDPLLAQPTTDITVLQTLVAGRPVYTALR